MPTATKAQKGRSLTAAAQILQGPRITRVQRPKHAQGAGWQQDAWAYYDEVGEFSWGVDNQAWAVSQVRLVAAREVPGEDEPEVLTGEVDEDDEGAEPPSELEQFAADLVAGFAGGTTGQQQLLRRVGVQLIVSAESYIVGRTVGSDEVWDAYSRDEIKAAQSGWKVDDGVDKFELSDSDVLIRVWLPHARKRQEPRSSTKALLPVLAEIRALTQSISAQVDSRLAGAGMLFFPQSIELIGANPETDFVDEVMDAVVTPIKDRDSASAVVPIMFKIPDEAIGKVQYLRFDAPSDVNDADKREKAMVRLARGMDMPPEQLLGMGDSNHWSAWQIDEATIKGPISSLAAIVVHALTIGWFRPALEAAFTPDDGITRDDGRSTVADEIDELMVWFDSAPLAQRPDRSEQAVQVFDRGGLSLTALVRETGFDDADIPRGPELCRVLLLKLITAAPELAVPLLARLGDCAGIGSIEDLMTQTAETVTGELEEGESTRALPERPAGQPVDDGADGAP